MYLELGQEKKKVFCNSVIFFLFLMPSCATNGTVYWWVLDAIQNWTKCQIEDSTSKPVEHSLLPEKSKHKPERYKNGPSIFMPH